MAVWLYCVLTPPIAVGTAEHEMERCGTRPFHCFIELLLSVVITSGCVYGTPADWDPVSIEFDDSANQSRTGARIYIWKVYFLTTQMSKFMNTGSMPKQFSGQSFRFPRRAGCSGTIWTTTTLMDAEGLTYSPGTNTTRGTNMGGSDENLFEGSGCMDLN